MSSLDVVKLSGPTHFNEIIKHVSEIANNVKTQNERNYQILLIITDGVINDMQETIDEIVYGSYLPLRIIIVGVGDFDFEAMRWLSNVDEEPLYSEKHKLQMESDIVQFMHLKDFKDDPDLLA